VAGFVACAAEVQHADVRVGGVSGEPGGLDQLLRMGVADGGGEDEGGQYAAAVTKGGRV
jgi:hypothetical protein